MYLRTHILLLLISHLPNGDNRQTRMSLHSLARLLVNSFPFCWLPSKLLPFSGTPHSRFQVGFSRDM